MKKVKKVLHIIPGFGGGISSHVRNIINNINTDKAIIDVASFTNYPEFFKNEIKINKGKAFVLKNVRLANINGCIKEYITILKNGNYDAIHIHMTDIQAAYFSILSRLMGVNRIIVHAHIANQPNSNTIVFKIKKIIKQKLTVAVASDLASCSKISSEFIFGYKNVRKDKVMHIPNSIDISKYNYILTEKEKNHYYKEFNISSNKLIIGHVGYFGYQKNHLFMLELIKRMKQRNMEFTWIFIGIGHDFDKIKLKAEIMNISDKICFLGRRSDVNKIYQIMDVSILPSHYEGLPTVTIESQIAGVNTIISDTITTETDMGLGMISRLSLSDSIDIWIDEIIKSSRRSILSIEKRIEAIEKKCFSAEKAAELYEKFISKEIMTYNLGDEIEF